MRALPIHLTRGPRQPQTRRFPGLSFYRGGRIKQAANLSAVGLPTTPAPVLLPNAQLESVLSGRPMPPEDAPERQRGTDGRIAPERASRRLHDQASHARNATGSAIPETTSEIIDQERAPETNTRRLLQKSTSSEATAENSLVSFNGESSSDRAEELTKSSDSPTKPSESKRAKTRRLESKRVNETSSASEETEEPSSEERICERRRKQLEREKLKSRSTDPGNSDPYQMPSISEPGPVITPEERLTKLRERAAELRKDRQPAGWPEE